MDRNIQLKLSIDGKEAIATLNLTDSKLEEIIRKVKTPKKVPSPIQTSDVTQVNAMNQALGQFGWVLGDADMFLVNFRMGLMSIGNNIPMVVQGMIRARQEANDLKISFGKSLVQSLTGAGGLMVAINAAMFAVNLLTAAFAGQNKEVEKQKDEVGELIKTYKDFSSTVQETEKSALQFRKNFLDTELKAIESRKIIVAPQAEREFGVIEGETRKFATPADKERFESYTEMLKEVNRQLNEINTAADNTKAKVASIMAGTYSLNTINEVKGAIDVLNKERADLDAAGRKPINERILQLEKIRSIMEDEVKLQNEKKGLHAAELTKEIETTKLKISQSKAAADIVFYTKQLIDLEKQLSEVNKPAAKAAGIYSGSPLKAPKSLLGTETGTGRNPVKESNSELMTSLAITEGIGDAWRRTGSIMSNALSKGLGLLNETNNVLLNILQTIAQIAIEIGVSLLTKLLAFELGLPLGSKIGSSSSPFSPIPVATAPAYSINISVAGSSTLKGRDLYTTYNKERLISEKYK